MVGFNRDFSAIMIHVNINYLQQKVVSLVTKVLISRESRRCTPLVRKLFLKETNWKEMMLSETKMRVKIHVYRVLLHVWPPELMAMQVHILC